MMNGAMVSGHVIPELEAFTVGTSVMLNSRHRSLPCTPAIGRSSEIEMDRWLMSRHESVRVTMLYNPVPFLSESHFLIWHGKKLLQSCDSARVLTFPQLLSWRYSDSGMHPPKVYDACDNLLIGIAMFTCYGFLSQQFRACEGLRLFQ